MRSCRVRIENPLATDIYVSNKVLTIDASRNIDLNHIVVRIDHGRRETFRDDVIVVSQGSPAPSVVPVYSEDGQLSVTSLTYFGNDLADRLYNDTYLSSWVDLRGGDDYVRGGSGDDEVFGGLGDDTIQGGAGDDVLDGGFGNDVISGQSGNDRIIGGNGDDSLSGGTGRDGLFGGQGADEIWGGPDADRFLRTKRFEDYRYETPRWWQLFKLPAYMPIDSINDASPADTSVYFEDGAATIVSLNGTPTQFREGRWTDDEILLVDQALDVLARRTNSNTLVRRPDGTELVFIRVGTQLSDASNNRFSGFNSGTITLSDGGFRVSGLDPTNCVSRSGALLGCRRSHCRRVSASKRLENSCSTFSADEQRVDEIQTMGHRRRETVWRRAFG